VRRRCHPVELLDYLPSNDWNPVYRATLTNWGISSEVLVASVIQRVGYGARAEGKWVLGDVVNCVRGDLLRGGMALSSRVHYC
jgi:hypothetical protein